MYWAGRETPRATHTGSTMAVTFNKAEVFEGIHSWDIFVDGELVGEMEKYKPSRYHGNGVSGMVQDRQAAWMWCASVILTDSANTIHIDIPEGSTAWEARRIIKAAVC